MNREALKLALEALEMGLPLIEDFGSKEQFNIQHKAIAAIYETLAQQNEFKPDWDEKLALTEEVIRLSKRIEELEAQPEQEPWLLETTQTLAKHMAREFYPEVTQWQCLDNLAGVISQIDNMTTGLMRKPEQEPVAWEQFYPDMGKPKLAYLSPTESPDNACYTPPQRTWVGLTEKEIDQGLCRTNYAMQTAGAWRDGVDWAIKQLREKNNG